MDEMERYNLERCEQGLGPITPEEWEHLIETGELPKVGEDDK